MKQMTQPQLKMNLAKALAAIAIIAVGLSGFTSAASAADRVGNGNGRTVELALTKLNEKVPGVDAFHKILYAFENGTRIDVVANSGLWNGMSMSYNRVSGILDISALGPSLALNSVDQGPLLDPVEAGQWVYATIASKAVFESFNWAIDHPVRLEGRSTIADGLERSVELRSYRGVLVGVARPDKNGACWDGVAVKEPNVCSVVYLFKRAPFGK